MNGLVYTVGAYATGAEKNKITQTRHNTNSRKTGCTPLRHVCMCVCMYSVDHNIELCTRGRESLDGSFQEIGAGTLLERCSNVLDEGAHIGTKAIVQVFCSYSPVSPKTIQHSTQHTSGVQAWGREEVCIKPTYV